MATRIALTLAASLASGMPASAAELPDVLQRPAEISSRAPSSALLGIARAGSRLVAVGERGIVLLSDDNGASWRQSPAPVSVSLTAVQFVDARRGWAVGHCGVVLASTDGGATWSLRLDGVKAARLAQQATAQSQDAERLVRTF